jgi:hypothetical protein
VSIIPLRTATPAYGLIRFHAGKSAGDVNIGYWQKTASHLPDFIDANSLIRAAMLPLQPLE